MKTPIIPCALLMLGALAGCTETTAETPPAETEDELRIRPANCFPAKAAKERLGIKWWCVDDLWYVHGHEAGSSPASPGASLVDFEIRLPNAKDEPLHVIATQTDHELTMRDTTLIYSGAQGLHLLLVRSPKKDTMKSNFTPVEYSAWIDYNHDGLAFIAK